MTSFHEHMTEYKKQMQQGTISAAYKELMDYLLHLKTYFKTNYPDYIVSGSLYPGYMDMTYFSFSPASLQKKNLKIAIVFIHATCRFEVWLAGYNKQVQRTYWNLVKEHAWKTYHVPSTTTGVDSILESVLVDNPDFGDTDTLTTQIEKGTLQFIRDVERFLSKHEH